jgi:VWFA-related protein
MDTALESIQSSHMDSNFFLIKKQERNFSPLQTPSGSVSRLDTRAPEKAKHEYEKGYQFLIRKNLDSAIEHLTKSTAIYPSFVAAHNALGTAYLRQGKDERALDEFARAVAVDDHLPTSYLNLACAQLALKHYLEAEASLKKASEIAPLDLLLRTALAYAEFANHDYPAVFATVRQVHAHKHDGAALVHYFAAASWQAQDNLVEAQREMETLLYEDPNSKSSAQFRQNLDEIITERARQVEASLHPAPLQLSAPASTEVGSTPQETSAHSQQDFQGRDEARQIADAEAQPDTACVECGTTAPVESVRASSAGPPPEQLRQNDPDGMLRVAVDEVAVYFAATDHGKSVTDLSASQIKIQDDNKPPAAILGFRNESQLPLRLGLIIDTSGSVRDRFSFEQDAASKFLRTVVNDRNDLAFVVGVNSSVLLVQDFTDDQSLVARAISQLAPSGGTALWDAVDFAADKMASRREVQPVARVLVVISDGEDNSSSVTLKEAIAEARRGEVAIYTVSTRDGSRGESSELLGDHALRTLSELTGGATFAPGSVRSLNVSLANLQQVIRGRYLVSYKPASLHYDGRYRAIDIKAQRDNHKLRVYARKGYYASAAQPGSSHP